ncbi:MAG TPA: LptA/OstA family protein [Nitrospiraceae bacterium]|nr:LptA/OstA family protein [Nitrospiraceae bacterium]
MWIWLLLLNLIPLGMASLGESADAALPQNGVDQAVGTTITAKKMTVKNQDSQAVFEGTVILTRGSLVVYSDRMVVTFRTQDPVAGDNQKGHDAVKGVAPAKEPGTMPAVSNRSVNKIEATGRVKIEKDSGSATCEKAIYYHDGDKIVLTGDPVAWDKGTRVSGKQITMFLTEDRSVVEGGSHVRIEPDGGATK